VLLFVFDPLRPLPIVPIEPLVAFFRQRLRWVEQSLFVRIGEVIHFRIGDCERRGRARFQNLAQVHHRLHLVQAEDREECQHMVGQSGTILATQDGGPTGSRFRHGFGAGDEVLDARRRVPSTKERGVSDR
jgi:hypothetical protein